MPNPLGSITPVLEILGKNINILPATGTAVEDLQHPDQDEAHFICALLNSVMGDFAIRAFYSGGGGGIASPAVLQKIRVPRFDSADKVHQELSGLSQNAHYAVAIGDEAGLRELEQPIDELVAQLWGLTKAALREIQESLAELRS